MTILKVSSKSSPSSVAGAIAKTLQKEPALEITAIGAGAVNQTVKAIAIARGYLAPIGTEITCIPAFGDVEIDGEERSSIKFTVNRK
jgi:stage V sporulation protein S